jgi:hypothetical protein
MSDFDKFRMGVLAAVKAAGITGKIKVQSPLGNFSIQISTL